MKHQIELTNDGVRCPLCFCSWKKPPMGECPGVRWYDYNSIKWEEITTVTQLREKRLKPKDKKKPDGCYYRNRGDTWIWLYRIDEALPIPERTEKQQAALEKASAVLKANHTCQRCGYYDRAHGQNRYTRILDVYEEGKEARRLCGDCIEAEREEEGWRNLEKYMKEILENDEPICILDTETTGLPSHSHFQVVEISVIDKHGTVLFDSLIKPDCPIPAIATGVHGITDEMVANAPTFSEVWPVLEQIIERHTVYCYNVNFDRSTIWHSAVAAGLKMRKELRNPLKWYCMMEAYAEYYGDWSEYHESYTWQSLASACQDLGVESSGYHRALGDVNNTLGVMRALAARAQ